eukprot:m.99530 g.99530  ORF g.99530 m.99530 type:complete len:196 (-) comp14908_c0_seq3:222-809(-)
MFKSFQTQASASHANIGCVDVATALQAKVSSSTTSKSSDVTVESMQVAPQSSLYTVTIELGKQDRFGILTADVPSLPGYLREDTMIIRELLPASPAWMMRSLARKRLAQAEILQCGDVICKIDDNCLACSTRDEALALLRKGLLRHRRVKLTLRSVPTSTRAQLTFEAIFPESCGDATADPATSFRRRVRSSVAH